MCHFSYFRFAYPIFLVICGIKTSSSSQKNFFLTNTLIKIVHLKKLTKTTFRTVKRQNGAPFCRNLGINPKSLRIRDLRTGTPKKFAEMQSGMIPRIADWRFADLKKSLPAHL
jgi:hypothetical protein